MNKKDFVKILRTADREWSFYDITELGRDKVLKLPFALRVLLENLVRKSEGDDLEAAFELVSNKNRASSVYEIPFYPARVLMQDFTGVPAVVDLAAMRDAVAKMGQDPQKINPLVPVDLVIDHSVQIDFYGQANALTKNVEKEYDRNHERYVFLKWAQKSFRNFRVVPPNSGICHQVNLEYLAKVVLESSDSAGLLYPDTVVGTDSHTTMINGLGVLGWGVGGIEAEAVMLGQAYSMGIPDVVGMKLTGRLQPGTTATDLVLTVTEKLRKFGVVEKFVEFFGPGLRSLTLPDRATIANMSPEYGATMGFFPVDEVTIDYLRFTGREKEAEIAEAYCRANEMFYTEDAHPDYRAVLELDLGDVVPSLAGPNRPQDRLKLADTKAALAKVLPAEAATRNPVWVDLGSGPVEITDGIVTIASITSCTNTANPTLMLGSALLAKKAVDAGLRVPSWVKTSLAPGSKAVQDYLELSGLMSGFETLGFHLAAFGCVTCIGNSGPLHPALEKAQTEYNLAYAAVLSGNRNFEGRIHPNVKASFLASPLLVVAFALAGKVNIDLTSEPLGTGSNGQPVYLKDVWPSPEEVAELVRRYVTKEAYQRRYRTIFDGDTFWKNLPTLKEAVYTWDPDSTYLQCPPYFEPFQTKTDKLKDIHDARCLLLLGDSITTDHISPAGNIRADYPAGKYLESKGVAPVDFNSYGARRGNHEVMMRGTFANIRLKNRLVDPKEGSFTLKLPEGTERFVYDAAMAYKAEHKDLAVLGGKEYGTGSSRDWAAKGTMLLGIRVVIAQSFERIHRSNLVGMGVLPLVFLEAQSASSLGLTGRETLTVRGLDTLVPGQLLTVEARDEKGMVRSFQAKCRLDTDVEVEYFRHRGILPYVLRKILTE
ncbi:MAG: aconitate hydratase AcnA [Spirochaetales bacterium]|nr:aconitate hydratase AcnA [Spirochaetales bacterium]